MAESPKYLDERSLLHRLLPPAVAFATVGVVTLVGVIFWFKPIEQYDRPGTFVPSAPVSLAIYCGLSVILYDWAVRHIDSYWTAAFIIGAAQVILVIDLTLRGDRGPATAAAGTALIFVTWASVACIYRLFAGRPAEN
ncbi:MAG: hypothetical protein AB7V18_16285 [Pyrinomonadaceae bacterium]